MTGRAVKTLRFCRKHYLCLGRDVSCKWYTSFGKIRSKHELHHELVFVFLIFRDNSFRSCSNDLKFSFCVRTISKAYCSMGCQRFWTFLNCKFKTLKFSTINKFFSGFSSTENWNLNFKIQYFNTILTTYFTT